MENLTHTAMKRLIIPALFTASLLLGACSSQRMAQQQSYDDVYGTDAKALVVERPKPAERNYRTDEQLYGQADYGNYGDDGADYDYDYGYASRIDRFNYGSPYRSYYDGWYSYMYDPWADYGYNYGANMSFNMGWGFGAGWGIGLGWGRPYFSNFYSPWGYWGYGYPGWANYWGPVSYYGMGWPGYGFGWGGGYWGGGGWGIASRPNRPRPSMGTGNPNYNRGNNRGYTNGRGDVSQRPAYQPGSRPSIDRGGYDRPAVRAERPERNSYPSYTPSTSSRGSYGGGGGGGYGGGGGGGTRGTGRGSR